MLAQNFQNNTGRGPSGRASGVFVRRGSDMSPLAPARTPSPLKLFSSHKQPEEEDYEMTQKAQKRWTADYLTELRKPSGARPMGARPPPGRTSTSSFELPPRAASSLALDRPVLANPVPPEKPKRSISPFRLHRSSLGLENRQHAGRPLAREPDLNIVADIARANANKDNIKVDINGEKTPMPYYERGQRWMERQEAKSLRAAMDYMELEDEKRIHSAAQEEASELVWKHKFADKPYKNPDTLKHTIKDHLRIGSHARSQSIGPFETLHITKGGVKEGTRNASDGSTSNKSQSSNSSKGSRVVSGSSKGSNESSGSSGKRYGSLSFIGPATKLFGSRRSSRKSRNSSGGKNSGLFNNPHDKIYEEPESIVETEEGNQDPSKILTPKSRNISGSHQQAATHEGSDFLAKTSFITENRMSSIDIHKNPPSQSRNPNYTKNEVADRDHEGEKEDEKPAMKDGKEIRGEDIRAATSMRMRDRSENLPKPTFVSDSPGRPIVSFNSVYTPKNSDGHSGSRSSTMTGSRPLPGGGRTSSIDATTSPVPAINLPSQKNDTNIESPSVPSISFPDETPTRASIASVPSINLPSGSATAPRGPVIHVPGENDSRQTRPNQALRGHWSRAAPRGTGALCDTCGHHITGRTLTAAGERFHPECFNCFVCGTNLEHVAFYPEPDSARQERLASEFGASTPGSQDTRFFCHLDFHENFSPRCKSCKTPIEGEVVLACGSQWHQGHFFCAQCGDPFDSEKPFIEKDGWAWCVGCFKGRYSGKCRGCKKPVIDDGVMALGAEWHASCFKCKECNGPFEDGRFFTRGEGTDPVCVRCEERRLKA